MKQIISDIKLYGASSTLFNDPKISEDKLVKYLSRKNQNLINFNDESTKNVIPASVFHPNGTFLSSWYLITALVLLYTAIIDPFVVSFVTTET